MSAREFLGGFIKAGYDNCEAGQGLLMILGGGRWWLYVFIWRFYQLWEVNLAIPPAALAARAGMVHYIDTVKLPPHFLCNGILAALA